MIRRKIGLRMERSVRRSTGRWKMSSNPSARVMYLSAIPGWSWSWKVTTISTSLVSGLYDPVAADPKSRSSRTESFWQRPTTRGSFISRALWICGAMSYVRIVALTSGGKLAERLGGGGGGEGGERQATDGGRWKRMFCCDVTRRSKGGGASAVGGGEEVRDGRCLMFNVGF